MYEGFKEYNVLATSFFCMILIVVIFSSDNPLLIFSIFLINLVIFCLSKSYNKLITGFKLFIPFSVVTIVINMVFVWEGKITLFYILGKRFTLESLIYSVILSSKLLLIIFVFMMLELMIDSDRAVSYFSSKLPKSTLMLLISLKLFPNMKNRIKNLRDVYFVRGVNFNSGGLKEKVKSNVPILSILLENSLDGAFDIGEAAFVRGFLAADRTVYDKQIWRPLDYILVLESVVLMIFFIYGKIKGRLEFQVYYGLDQTSLLNPTIILLLSIIAIIIITLALFYKMQQTRKG